MHVTQHGDSCRALIYADHADRLGSLGLGRPANSTIPALGKALREKGYRAVVNSNPATYDGSWQIHHIEPLTLSC